MPTAVPACCFHLLPGMCGICGSTDDPDGMAVRAMCDRMVYRGPDDEGIHVDPTAGVAIGARRLAIIDVGGGHQPVGNEDHDIWAVLNGEIYNHPELQRLLTGRGHTLSSRTDTEVLVHLYEEYGDALVHALEGMFTFAIWDARRRRLLIARDRFGEKPLFVHQIGQRLAFASELSALAAGLDSGLQLDPAAIDDYYVRGYFTDDAPVLRDVRQLAPGHTLAWTADDGRSRTTRYWTMPARPVRDDRSQDEITGELELLLRTSVRRRLIADVPIGVFLSGGLDSRLVATLAVSEHGGRLQTFTVSYDVGTVNESDGARAVAAALGTEHHDVKLGGRELTGQTMELLASIDQPIADPALIPLYALSRAAVSEVTVAVGGEGADELFGGYPRYRWLAHAARFDDLLPAALGSAVNQVAARVIKRPGINHRVSRLAGLALGSPLPERHLDWVTDRRGHVRGELYGCRLQSAMSDRALRDATEVLDADLEPSIAAQFMELDRRRWLPNDVLMKADRASMLNSLEMRTPFLDRSVAEFSAGLPVSQLLKDGGKAPLRRVLARLPGGQAPIPPKTAFRVPLDEWLRGPLAAWSREVCCDSRLVSDGWFDRSALIKLLDEQLAGADHAWCLWPAIALGAWLESTGRPYASG